MIYVAEMPVADAQRCLPVLDSRAVHVWYHKNDAAGSSSARRALLQTLLGSYLQTNPHLLTFTTGAYGKPRLSPEIAEDIRFSVSSTHGMMVIAITRGREVGVDVEFVRQLPAHDVLSDQVWTPDERARMEALPPHERSEAFLVGWVRKEACLKALGLGLSKGMQFVEVSLKREDPRPLHSLSLPNDKIGSDISLVSLDLHRDYVAALALN